MNNNNFSPDQYAGNGLSKEDYQDARRAEILWGQAANLVFINTKEGVRRSMKECNEERIAIFKWLWQTRNDYKQILGEEKLNKSNLKDQNDLSFSLDLQKDFLEEGHDK